MDQYFLIIFWGVLTDALFLAILVWISSSDITQHRIPNRAIWLLLILGLFKLPAIILSGQSWWLYPPGILTGLPFFYLWLKNQMGAGDVKLFMASGWYLGLVDSLISLVVLLIILSAAIFVRLCFKKPLNERLPLAPFISLACSVVIAAQYVVLHIAAGGW
jgi:leader peptidase (prepilin peptidase) / N-methyltransferase